MKETIKFIISIIIITVLSLAMAHFVGDTINKV